MTDSWALNIVAIIPERVFFHCDYERDGDAATLNADGAVQVFVIRVKKSKGLSEVSALTPVTYRKCSYTLIKWLSGIYFRLYLAKSVGRNCDTYSRCTFQSDDEGEVDNCQRAWSNPLECPPPVLQSWFTSSGAHTYIPPPTCMSQVLMVPSLSAVTRYFPQGLTAMTIEPRSGLWASNSPTRQLWRVFQNLTTPEPPHDTRSAPPEGHVEIKMPGIKTHL